MVMPAASLQRYFRKYLERVRCNISSHIKRRAYTTIHTRVEGEFISQTSRMDDAQRCGPTKASNHCERADVRGLFHSADSDMKLSKTVSHCRQLCSYEEKRMKEQCRTAGRGLRLCRTLCTTDNHV